MNIQLYNKVDAILKRDDVSVRILETEKDGDRKIHLVVLKCKFGLNEMDNTYGYIPTNTVLHDIYANSESEILTKLKNEVTLDRPELPNTKVDKKTDTTVKAIEYTPSQGFTNENGFVDVKVSLTLKMAVEPETGNVYINENELFRDIYEWSKTISAMNTRMETPLRTVVNVYELMENGNKVKPESIKRVK